MPEDDPKSISIARLRQNPSASRWCAVIANALICRECGRRSKESTI